MRVAVKICYNSITCQGSEVGGFLFGSLPVSVQPHTVVNKAPLLSGVPVLPWQGSAGQHRWNGGFVMSNHHESKARLNRCCVDCGVIISPWRSVRCKSCGVKESHRRGLINTAESLTKHSATMKKTRSSESYGKAWQEKVSDSHKQRWTPELRKQHSRNMQAVMDDHPEFGVKIRELWAQGVYDHRVMPSPTSIEIAIREQLDCLQINHTPQYRPPHCSAHKRERQKAQWAEEHGYLLLTVWELDIKQYGPLEALMTVLNVNTVEDGAN